MCCELQITVMTYRAEDERPARFRRVATCWRAHIYTRPTTTPLLIEYYVVSRRVMDIYAAQLDLQVTFLYAP